MGQADALLRNAQGIYIIRSSNSGKAPTPIVPRHQANLPIGMHHQHQHLDTGCAIAHGGIAIALRILDTGIQE